MPSAVAGILTSRLGSAIRSCRRAAAAIVASVSWASSGATSIDTNPSLPCGVEGRTQHRQRIGDVVDDEFPVGVLQRIALRGEDGELLVVGVGALDGPGKIVGLAVTPRIPSATKAASVPSRR